MRPCACPVPHLRRRLVLTGGPGAGKTAVLELLRQSICTHVTVLPEAAGILFNDGFPRDDIPGVRRAAQRAIFHVQRELEEAMEARGVDVMLCDRGLADGEAYWPGPKGYWSAVGITREEAFARYDVVIHLRVPAATNGYGLSNPLRIETAAEALAIDDRILAAWAGHPRRHIVEPSNDFLTKATLAMDILRGELPECCRTAASPTELDGVPGLASVPR